VGLRTAPSDQALIDDIATFCDNHPKVLDDIEGLLTDNRIFKQRNVDIGVVKLDDAWNRGFSGEIGRASCRERVYRLV
jgi:NADH-quinone oxidoreductase subunit D